MEPIDDKKNKKRKRTPTIKKSKSNKIQAVKVEEDPLSLNLNEGSVELPGSAELRSASLEDDSEFFHLVLTAVLNKKKMELIENEEVMKVLLADQLGEQETVETM